MLDIIVVPRDRFSTFPRCLEALYAHTNERFRLFVIAGGVDAETGRYLRMLERARQNLHVELAGHLLQQGEARNIAFRLAGERLCVVVENDTIVHEGWLAPLVACMRAEAAAAVMPLVLWYRGIHADARFPGILDHAELLRGLREHRWDVALLPSLETDEDREGIPVFLIEAMAAGVPVVATDTGGIPELLHGGAGLLVPPRYAGAIGDALARLAVDARLREQLAEAGMRRAREPFTVESSIAALVAAMTAEPRRDDGARPAAGP